VLCLHCLCTCCAIQAETNLLIIHVGIEPIPMQCSSGFWQMQCPLMSVAVQNRLTAASWLCTHTLLETCSLHRWGMTHHQCAALLRANFFPHCSVLLCKTSSQQAYVTATTPIKYCSSYSRAVPHHQRTAALAKYICECSVLLCKQGSQQAFVTAITHLKILCSYRCAVAHLPCSGTLLLAQFSRRLGGVIDGTNGDNGSSSQLFGLISAMHYLSIADDVATARGLWDKLEATFTAQNNARRLLLR